MNFQAEAVVEVQWYVQDNHAQLLMLKEKHCVQHETLCLHARRRPSGITVGNKVQYYRL